MENNQRREFLSSAAMASTVLAATALGTASSDTFAHERNKKHSSHGFEVLKIDNTALVLVDHQVGTIGWAGELASEEERNQLKMWVKVITRFAKSAQMPIVFTTSLENEAQGPLLPELKEIAPSEYDARIKRFGVINAWDDPAFVDAVRKTGKKNILMGGLTTDVCLVPPALSAKSEGLNVVALMDISAATTRLSAQNSRDIFDNAKIDMMTVTPMITSILGNYKNPASKGFFEAMGKEGVFAAYAKGNLR